MIRSSISVPLLAEKYEFKIPTLARFIYSNLMDLYEKYGVRVLDLVREREGSRGREGERGRILVSERVQ